MRKLLIYLGLKGWLFITAIALPCAEAAIRTSGSPYALSGSIGLFAEKYEVDVKGSHTSEDRWGAVLDVNGGGYVWDPRFMVFRAGIGLSEETTSSDQVDGGTKLRAVNYSLSTLWFPGRTNPLTLYANSTRNRVDWESGPSYDLDSRSVGGNWGVKSRRLGDLRLSFGRMENESSGEIMRRHDWSDQVELEGRRRVATSGGIKSNVNYGYRYSATTNAVTDAKGRQHQVYVGDSTILTSATALAASASYAERHDEFSLFGAGEKSTQQDGRMLAATASLSTQTSERLRHSYSLGVGRTETGDAYVSTYTGNANLNYIYNERWQQSAVVGASYARIEQAKEVKSQQQQTASTGLTYAKTLGDFLLHGGYTIGVSHRQSDTMENGTWVSHGLNAGYARQASPLWQDHADFSVSVQDAIPRLVEKNARYGITSLPSPHDTVSAELAVRDYREEDDLQDTKSLSQLFSASWNRSLGSVTGVAVSGGYSRSQFDSLDPTEGRSSTESTFRHLQARFATGVSLGRNLVRLNFLLRHEAQTSSTSSDAYRTSLESSADLAKGLWQLRLKHRWRETEEGGAKGREQFIGLRASRRFGGRR